MTVAGFTEALGSNPFIRAIALATVCSFAVFPELDSSAAADSGCVCSGLRHPFFMEEIPHVKPERQKSQQEQRDEDAYNHRGLSALIDDEALTLTTYKLAKSFYAVD